MYTAVHQPVPEAAANTTKKRRKRRKKSRSSGGPGGTVGRRKNSNTSSTAALAAAAHPPRMGLSAISGGVGTVMKSRLPQHVTCRKESVTSTSDVRQYIACVTLLALSIVDFYCRTTRRNIKASLAVPSRPISWTTWRTMSGSPSRRSRRYSHPRTTTRDNRQVRKGAPMIRQRMSKCQQVRQPFSSNEVSSLLS